MTQSKKARPNKRDGQRRRLVADNRKLAKALDKNVAGYAPESGQVVVLDAARYEELIDRLDDLDDAAFSRRDAQAEPEEMVPFEMVERMSGGESPVRVWRQHRGLKAGVLAKRAGISTSYLSAIEHGKKDRSLAVMARIATALDLPGGRSGPRQHERERRDVRQPRLTRSYFVIDLDLGKALGQQRSAVKLSDTKARRIAKLRVLVLSFVSFVFDFEGYRDDLQIVAVRPYPAPHPSILVISAKGAASSAKVKVPWSLISRAARRKAPRAARLSADPTLTRLTPSSARSARLSVPPCRPITTLTGRSTALTTAPMSSAVRRPGA